MSEINLQETENTHLIIIASFPKARATDLFSHFTEADKLTKWWPQEAKTDPRTGGALHLSWPAMKWHLRGTFETFEPAKRLVFTWQWDHDPVEPKRVEITIEEKPEGATVTLKHGHYVSSDEDQKRRQEHIDGWNHFLGELSKLL